MSIGKQFVAITCENASLALLLFFFPQKRILWSVCTISNGRLMPGPAAAGNARCVSLCICNRRIGAPWLRSHCHSFPLAKVAKFCNVTIRHHPPHLPLFLIIKRRWSSFLWYPFYAASVADVAVPLSSNKLPICNLSDLPGFGMLWLLIICFGWEVCRAKSSRNFWLADKSLRSDGSFMGILKLA